MRGCRELQEVLLLQKKRGDNPKRNIGDVSFTFLSGDH
jgi:hypothetical protein